MKTKILLLITFLTFLCRASESVVVDCEFYYSDRGYKCEVQNSELITSKHNREISGVRGQHERRDSRLQTNDDVKFFKSDSRKVSFFPRGITNFFKNIDSVEIEYAEDLKEITREDLKQFKGRLKLLWLESDGIEVIEADLFEDNQNLEWLDLNDNSIRHIENGALTKLKKLTTFNFNGNPCKELSTIEEIEKACKDPTKRVATTTTQAPPTKNSLIAQLQSKTSTLTQQLSSTSNKLKTQMRENEKLKAEKEKSDKKVSQLEAENFKVFEENQKLKIKSEQEMKAHEDKKRDQEVKIASLEEKISKHEKEKLKLNEEVQKLKAKVQRESEGCDQVLKAFEEKFLMMEAKLIQQGSTFGTKLDQQSLNFESKINQILSKVIDEKNFESNLLKLIRKFENLSETVNAMGEKIEEKVEIYCKEEEIERSA